MHPRMCLIHISHVTCTHLYRYIEYTHELISVFVHTEHVFRYFVIVLGL